MKMETGSSGSKVDLRSRTKHFALRIIRLCAALPRTSEAQVIGKQVLRSGTSVGAHYREAYRSRSNAEYVAKIEGGLQEIEETAYWLELLGEAGIIKAESLGELHREAGELTAIFVTCSKSAKNRGRKETRPENGRRRAEDGRTKLET